MTTLDRATSYRAYVSAFWIDRREATVAAYRECVMSGSCPMPSSADARAQLAGSDDDVPIIGLVHPQMEMFCAVSSGRLPTSAEWVRAARGDDDRVYPWGGDTGCSYANWLSCTGALQPVGMYPSGASPYGVLDLMGNAAEHTSDSNILGTDTCDPSYPPVAPGPTTFWTARGGTWLSAPTIDMRGGTMGDAATGFRCAYDGVHR